ncbi:DUF2306 domain-containing protein [Amycolatopsis methanolica]|uniref:DUF2306 domain-containing protein n=1 Tax=Amycolatopsis methanolica TaxID=1814 RepID=UPI001CC257B6|nr:DUF2306 domain-containing protein [Amycolatopsis methanolica]
MAGRWPLARSPAVRAGAGAPCPRLLGLYIGWHTAAGPSVCVANLVGSALWLAVTATGWRMARRRRFGDHRKWMARSFALAMSIVLSRAVNVVATIVLTPQVDTTFLGSAELMTYSAASWNAAVRAWSGRSRRSARPVRSPAPVRSPPAGAPPWRPASRTPGSRRSSSAPGPSGTSGGAAGSATGPRRT